MFYILCIFPVATQGFERGPVGQCLLHVRHRRADGEVERPREVRRLEMCPRPNVYLGGGARQGVR